MKRQKITLEEIADYKNLLIALHKASRGKRHREVVQAFYGQVDYKLTMLAKDILSENLPYGRFKSFQIFDPKKRLIHAACFEDRIFHHAVMNIAGQRIEKSMVYHSYACRKNKGVHKAVKQVRYNLQRYSWFVKIDIAAYFSHIDHAILLSLLKHRYSGRAFHRQLQRIIKSCPEMSHRGLPIGSLTSQYFANFYLDGLDRFLGAHNPVRAVVRYMDDVIWWCDSKQQAKHTLSETVEYLKEQRSLQVKSTIQMLPSHAGVSYCGFRITQGNVRLSQRRKRSIKQKRQYWEQAFIDDHITANELQMAYASIHAISQGTNSTQWRSKQLLINPPVDV